MFLRCALLTVSLGALIGCIQKPEGPAERIGRSIDEISSAIQDMSQDDQAQADRFRRERERRDREAALRREQYDRLNDETAPSDRAEYDLSDDDSFNAEADLPPLDPRDDRDEFDRPRY